jgi:hypothetical protein
VGRKERNSKAGRAGPGCAICDADAAFLRSSRPPYEALRPRVRVVDLFSGCGGLTLGAAEAARHLGLGLEVRLAVDADKTATDVYQANLPSADARCGRVEALFDGQPGDALTEAEAKIKRDVGAIDVLMGGAAVLGRSDIGSLEPGKCADFFALDLSAIGYAGGLSDPVAAVVFWRPRSRALRSSRRPAHRRSGTGGDPRHGARRRRAQPQRGASGRAEAASAASHTATASW